MFNLFKIFTLSVITLCLTFKTNFANHSLSNNLNLTLKYDIFTKHIDKQISTNSIPAKPKAHISNKYWVQSIIIPGLGQIKNKKYWKLPIIYIGGAAMIYSIVWNASYYKEMINEYKARTENNTNLTPNPIYDNVPLKQFVNAANYYRRNMTLSIIGAAAIYGLQILDAYIDQELSTFDINNNLALKIQPQINNFTHSKSITDSIYYGIKINFILKRI